MRGWITSGNASRPIQLAANEAFQLGERATEIVVHDPVLEGRLELELTVRGVEALFDLAGALGRPRPQPALQDRAARRRHEDRHRLRDPFLDGERAAGLDLEQRRVPTFADAVELRPERPGAVAGAPGQLDPLEEVALGKLAVELVLRDEPVVAAVLLVRAARP